MPEREANPYKIINQYKRAFRLLETMRLDLEDSFGHDFGAHGLAAAIHDMPEGGWVTAAERAGIDPPSEETIERITELAVIAVEVQERAAEFPIEDFNVVGRS